jgi:(2R)-3-sulfolactate dehydrogenase (NADP+)
MAQLVAAFHGQEGARLPGDGRNAKRQRAAREGVPVNIATLQKIEAILGNG